MASRRKRADAEGGAFQLPDDVVSKGSRQTGPFRHEQVFFSPSLNFEGTEREFVAAGHGYQFEQTDPHTRRVVNQRQMAGRKRANSKGKYVTLIQTPNNKLEIVPNPTTIAQFVDENRDHLPTDVLTALEGFETPGERRYNVWGDDQTLYELMDDFLSNGWQNVDPEEISALTDAPIFEAPDGRIYWHERYQVESAAEELVLGKTVMFDGAPENKAPVAKTTAPGDEGDEEEKGKTSRKKAGYGEVFDEPRGDQRHQRHELEEQCAGCGSTDRLRMTPDHHTLCQKCMREHDERRDQAFYGTEKRGSAKTAFDDAPMDADPMPDDAMDDDTIDDDGAPPPDDSDIDAPMAPEPSAAPPAAPPASSNVFEKWQTQNLIDTIEALTDSETFASDKAEQKSVEQMAEILSARPVERNNEDVKQAAVKMAKTALLKVRPRYLGIEAAVKSAAGMDEFTQALSMAKGASQSDVPAQDGDTGKHLEGDTSIPRGADFDEDHTGIPDVPTTLPKEATVPTTGSALKTTESMIDKLKALYLEAKPIVGVNGTRPVREGVEAIYHAMHALGQTQKILSKQLKQEEDDEKVMADKEKAKQKGKASSLLSNLILAAAEI